jgi:hypothetical protein
LLAYGDQTSDYEELKASLLARLLPDVHIRRFEGVHHFVPPEQIYNADHLLELRNLWSRAGVSAEPVRGKLSAAPDAGAVVAS